MTNTITADEVREKLAGIELWLYRQKVWGHRSRSDSWSEGDYDQEQYGGPGLDALFFDIPNM